MKAFDNCPVCGGELVEKEVEKLLRGGCDLAMTKAKATICLHCGERFFSVDTIERFEQIRTDLRDHHVDAFEPIGNAYKVA